jgi:hypothetical protein
MTERTVTAAGESPAGEGWTCIHSWANWEGRWWLWQRTAPRETLLERIYRLSCYWGSTRFALTLEDVIYDYTHGDRYAPSMSNGGNTK